MKLLYPELSPQPRFLKILEFHILPELEKDGFKLLKSGPSLKRNENGFEWIVEFNGSKFNVENTVCRFNPYFTVKNSNYRKYLKKNPSLVGGFGATGQIGTTFGIQHWDKKIFSIGTSEANFLEDNDFAKYDNEHLVSEFIKNIRNVGIPYFKMMSKYDTINEFYKKTEQLTYAPMLVDMCHILSLEDKMESIFDWYYSLNEGCAERLDEKMEIRKNNWLQQGVKMH